MFPCVLIATALPGSHDHAIIQRLCSHPDTHCFSRETITEGRPETDKKTGTACCRARLPIRYHDHFAAGDVTLMDIFCLYSTTTSSPFFTSFSRFT
jgi:hypothetical protein